MASTAPARESADVTIKPTRVLERTIRDTPYRFETFEFEHTPVKLVALEDINTGLRVYVFDPGVGLRWGALNAWSGARQSRSPHSPEYIVNEIFATDTDPNKKVGITVNGYGHMSVADMAKQQVMVHHGPLHLAYLLFLHGELNDGQEKSTRFQGQFANAPVQLLKQMFSTRLAAANPEGFRKLNKEYALLCENSVANMAEMRPTVQEAYAKFYRPDTGASAKNHAGALEARTLDTVRYFLPFGQNTGFAFGTSARDWSSKISMLKSMELPYYRAVGNQLEVLLALPEIADGDAKTSQARMAQIEGELGYTASAPSLIRHSEPDHTVKRNLSSLREYLCTTDLAQKCQRRAAFRGLQEQRTELLPESYTEAERTVASYIMTLFPGMEREHVLNWTAAQPVERKQEISRIIFRGHDRHHQLPQSAGASRQTLAIESDLGALRDWNRHRAQPRFLEANPQFYGQRVSHDDAKHMVAQGYGMPLYLQMPEFTPLREEFARRIEQHYAGVDKLLQSTHREFGEEPDYAFIMNVLPLAHHSKMWFHADPRQLAYLADLRSMPGGHINYRDTAYQIWEKTAAADPYLSGVTITAERPDPASREQFFSRK